MKHIDALAAVEEQYKIQSNPEIDKTIQRLVDEGNAEEARVLKELFYGHKGM